MGQATAEQIQLTYERLLKRCDERLIVPDLGPCLVFTGATNAKGYGCVHLAGTLQRTELAHRVAWLAVYGPIDDGMSVLHHCDVPACVAVESHHFLGSLADNNRDMFAKGRGKIPRADHHGEKNGKRKLTDAKVLEVRAMWATGKFSQSEIGALFGVHQSWVSDVVRRKCWTHI